MTVEIGRGVTHIFSGCEHSSSSCLPDHFDRRLVDVLSTLLIGVAGPAASLSSSWTARCLWSSVIDTRPLRTSIGISPRRARRNVTISNSSTRPADTELAAVWVQKEESEKEAALCRFKTLQPMENEADVLLTNALKQEKGDLSVAKQTLGEKLVEAPATLRKSSRAPGLPTGRDPGLDEPKPSFANRDRSLGCSSPLSSRLSQSDALAYPEIVVLGVIPPGNTCSSAFATRMDVLNAFLDELCFSGAEKAIVVLYRAEGEERDRFTRLAAPAAWLKERFDAVKATVPLFMRLNSFALIVDEAHRPPRPVPSRTCPNLCRAATTSPRRSRSAPVRMSGVVKSASLSPNKESASMAAGLPFFSAG
ncbi:hypothetical protein V8E36_003451 [Tilletia maclaganii]